MRSEGGTAVPQHHPTTAVPQHYPTTPRYAGPTPPLWHLGTTPPRTCSAPRIYFAP